MKNTFVLSLIVLGFFGCETVTEPSHKYDARYYDEVSITFADTINYDFIHTFLAGLDVGIRYINADSVYAMYLHVDSGDVRNYVSIFSNDPSVVWAQQGYLTPWDSSWVPFIIVQFKSAFSINNAFDLVKSIHGLSWIMTNYPMKNAAINVIKSKKQKYLDYFKLFSFVKNAE